MQKPTRGHFSEPENEDDSEWLMTFADLTTLLLCFFVLLFSISSVDNKKFLSIMNEVRINLGNAAPMMALEHKDVVDGGDAVVNILSKQKTVATELKEIISDEKLSNSTVVDMGDEGALLRVGGKVFFESGSAAINPKVHSALDKIVRMAQKNSAYHIDIKGHTDNLPISAGKFLSNWELSALRATTVLRYLLEKGLDPDRLTATGYADTQPLVPNLTAENRSRNRRVEFLFKKRAKKK